MCARSFAVPPTRVTEPGLCVAEAYEVPSVLDPNVDPSETGFRPRGIDVDRNGLI